MKEVFYKFLIQTEDEVGNNEPKHLVKIIFASLIPALLIPALLIPALLIPTLLIFVPNDPLKVPISWWDNIY